MTSANAAFDAGQPRRSLPVRWLAKAVEPIAKPMAGNRWFPLWAILRHTGRTSGKPYGTPIVALRTKGGFLIPLPFGDATQWAKNLFAAGGGSVRFGGREYRIAQPRILDYDEAKRYQPRALGFLTARLGLRQYVLVRELQA